MIGPWSTALVAEVTAGRLLGGDVAFEQVVTDSRQACGPDLFVALKGERFDAHDFVGEMIAKGARAAVVDHELSINVPQVVVEDTTKALGALGAENRRRYQGRVFAITGSVGKTTVKEILAAIMAQTGEVCKTQGNLNNHLGVPMSLLQLQVSHAAGVFELGASAVGEIAYTVALTAPDVAILNNAAASHVEGFGSLARIVQAKGEIFGALSAQGTAVLNRDDPHYPQWLQMCGHCQALSFGFADAADVRATELQLAPDAVSFRLWLREHSLDVYLPLPGKHNVRNALAASAAALAAGVPEAQIKAGLADVKAAKGRINLRQGQRGITVLDDTYNANPASMKAALDVLAAYPGRRVAVLGYMGELGAASASAHEEVAAYAVSSGVDELYVTGPESGSYLRGCPQAVADDDLDSLTRQLQAGLREGDIVLVKGSRSARMERVVDALCDQEGSRHE